MEASWAPLGLSSLPLHLLLLAEVSASSDDQVSHCAPSFRIFVASLISICCHCSPCDGFLLLLQVCQISQPSVKALAPVLFCALFSLAEDRTTVLRATLRLSEISLLHRPMSSYLC